MRTENIFIPEEIQNQKTYPKEVAMAILPF